MKKQLLLGWRYCFQRKHLLAIGLACAANAAAQTSPVGDWDLYFSGAQKGVAKITFTTNFTLTGFQIHAPGKPSYVFEGDPRGGLGNGRDPRTGFPTIGTNAISFGTADIGGYWGYDLKGKVVGVLTLVSLNHTNGLSFTAKVVQGSKPRITIGAMQTQSGRSVYQGVPHAVLPDFSGDYFATGKRGGKPYVEVTTLTTNGVPNSNYYLVDAYGPGFSGTGFAFFTANKHVGFYYDYFEGLSTNIADLFVVANSGAYKTNKLPTVSGNLSGTDGENNISLKFGRR